MLSATYMVMAYYANCPLFWRFTIPIGHYSDSVQQTSEIVECNHLHDCIQYSGMWHHCQQEQSDALAAEQWLRVTAHLQHKA